MLRNRPLKQEAGPRGAAPVTVTPRPDGWTDIDAHPADLPSAITILPIIASGIFAGIVFAMGGPWSSLAAALFTSALTWAVLGGILVSLARGLNNSKRMLQTSPFAVRPEAVRLPNGTEIGETRIYALTIRNGFDGHFTMVVTNSSIGAVSSAAAARNMAKVAAVSFRVDLDHDGRSTPLAGGLTDAQAQAVAAEVLRRMPALK
jgi:hypothetical protein